MTKYKRITKYINLRLLEEFFPAAEEAVALNGSMPIDRHIPVPAPTDQVALASAKVVPSPAAQFAPTPAKVGPAPAKVALTPAAQVALTPPQVAPVPFSRNFFYNFDEGDYEIE